MAQLNYGTGTFRQTPHVQKADCQLAAKGSADAGMEVSIEDRSKVHGSVPQTAATRTLKC